MPLLHEKFGPHNKLILVYDVARFFLQLRVAYVIHDFSDEFSRFLDKLVTICFEIADGIFEFLLDAQELIMVEFNIADVLDLVVDKIPLEFPLALKQPFLKRLPLKLTQVFLLKLLIKPEDVDIENIRIFSGH